MKYEMICSGFGGQGALTVGKFLALAGMNEGKHVSWLPSYGPEMRGGTANVSTVISDRPVASPLVTTPDILVALNQPSLDKFGPDVREGGLIIANSDLCPGGFEREGVDIVFLPMNTIAKECGSIKVTNMVSIGALLSRSDVVKIESVKNALQELLAEKKPALLEANFKAIDEGLARGKA
ncbi:MAG: 2-oxoacid:acceptor oxidoreductase family protein [Candidatus Cloacimonetes bacterium]|nr:2-oxoacid:acceptor oxidoreductase family protein [Candidatus Cloacimonadota bacterium]